MPDGRLAMPYTDRSVVFGASLRRWLQGRINSGQEQLRIASQPSDYKRESGRLTFFSSSAMTVKAKGRACPVESQQTSGPA